MTAMRVASIECRVGNRKDIESVKREAWRDMGVLVIDEKDPRLTWPERELVRNLGNRLMGKRPGVA